MMPFPGGIAATENGTLLLALAAALIHLIGAGEASPLRRMAAAAAPAALMAVLCAVLPGPALLLLSMIATAAGEVLLALDRPNLRAAARAAFGLSLAFALWLLGYAFAGGFVAAPRLAFATAAGLVLLAGVVPVFSSRAGLYAGQASSRVAVAIRHAGAILLSLAVLT